MAINVTKMDCMITTTVIGLFFFHCDHQESEGKKVYEFKYLGIFITGDLKWEGYVYVNSKVLCILYSLKLTLKATSPGTKLLAYSSLV